MPYQYDYYMVDIPGDLSDDMNLLAEQAITEAREMSRIYAIPAEWKVTRISGEIGDHVVRFKVRRKRYRTK